MNINKNIFIALLCCIAVNIYGAAPSSSVIPRRDVGAAASMFDDLSQYKGVKDFVQLAEKLLQDKKQLDELNDKKNQNLRGTAQFCFNAISKSALIELAALKRLSDHPNNPHAKLFFTVPNPHRPFDGSVPFNLEEAIKAFSLPRDKSSASADLEKKQSLYNEKRKVLEELGMQFDDLIFFEKS